MMISVHCIVMLHPWCSSLERSRLESVGELRVVLHSFWEVYRSDGSSDGTSGELAFWDA